MFMCKLFHSSKEAKPSKSSSPEYIRDFVAKRHGYSSYQACIDSDEKKEIDAEIRSYLGYNY